MPRDLSGPPPSFSVPPSLSFSVSLSLSPCHFLSFPQSKSLFFPLKCLPFSFHLLSWIHTRYISLAPSSFAPQPPLSLLPTLLTSHGIPSSRPSTLHHLLSPHRNMFYPSCSWVGRWCLLTVANGEFGESAAPVRNASVHNIL